MERLTPRQREIVELACVEGLSNAELARRLYITYDTVRNHRQRLFERLDLHTMQQVCTLYGRQDERRRRARHRVKRSARIGQARDV